MPAASGVSLRTSTGTRLTAESTTSARRWRRLNEPSAWVLPLSVTAARSPLTKLPASLKCTSISSSGSAATSPCSGREPAGRDRLRREAQARTSHIVAVDLDRQPAALELFGDVAGDVAARKRIEDQLPGL